MTTVAAKKKDGRANNGAENRGLTEAKVLLTMTAALKARVEERAKAERVPQAEVWRRAAELYLASPVE